MKKDHASFQRRPFLTPLWLMAMAALFALGFAVYTVWTWETAASTTVIVIRHAEKDLAANPTEPPLSAAGEARADLLARMFGDAATVGRVDAIYTSAALRSRLTAAPLAARLRISSRVWPADDPSGLARHVLQDHPGGRVLIVGHSDNVAQIVAALSGIATIPQIEAQDYSTMYIVTVPQVGHANVLRLKY